MAEAGPLATAIWRAVPMLEQVDPEALDGFGPAEVLACDLRVAGGHLCVLCGEAARCALIARPQRRGESWAPVWVDLCAGCFRGLNAEGNIFR